jgi:hypothetical protein
MRAGFIALAIGLCAAIGCAHPGVTSAAGSAMPLDAGPDAGAANPADAGISGDKSCGTALSCEIGCAGAMACQQGCFDEATPAAQALLDALDGCLNQQCPMTDAGVCADPSSGNCFGCQAGAVLGSGPCSAQHTACTSDTSGDAGTPADAG